MDRIYGKHCVRAALNAGRRKQIFKLSVYYKPVKKGLKASQEQLEVGEMIEVAKSKGIIIDYCTKQLLDQWSQGRPHQNLILTASHLNLPSINTLPAGITGLSLALENLKDPQNIGSLIRSAYFLGASSVIISGLSNSSPSMATISKASAGALELWDRIYLTDKLPELFFAYKAQSRGSIIATVPCESEKVRPLNEVQKIENGILALGSEGAGLSKSTLASSNIFVSIPRDPSRSSLVDSLNVSAAGSIIINSIINNN